MGNKIPARPLVLGILIMVIASVAAACGGDTQVMEELTPTPVTQATAAPTDTGPGTTTQPSTSPPGPTTQAVTATPRPISAATVAPVEPTKPAVVIKGSVELSLIIMKRSADDIVSVLEEGDVMTANDFYGFFFEPAGDSWVYVLQQDSSRAVDVLFPNPAYSEATNPVSAGTPVWIPKDIDNWFFLDNNVGPETFFVVASTEQNKELESIIAGNKREEVLGPLAAFLSTSRGPGGTKKLDKAPIISPNGNALELEQQVLQGDGDNFVYTLEFLHE